MDVAWAAPAEGDRSSMVVISGNFKSEVLISLTVWTGKEPGLEPLSVMAKDTIDEEGGLQCRVRKRYDQKRGVIFSLLAGRSKVFRRGTDQQWRRKLHKKRFNLLHTRIPAVKCVGVR